MNEVVMLVGNIGTGKGLISSRYAKKGYTVVNMDSIQASMSGGEYGLYDPLKKDIYRCVEHTIIEMSLKRDISVCIDRMNIDVNIRKRYVDFIKSMFRDVDFICYDFGMGNDFAFERRLKNNRNIPDDVWESVYEYNKKKYEKPTKKEGFKEIIDMQNVKYKYYAFDFYGTIVKHKFPEIGERNESVIDYMYKLSQDHKNIIIIWSCRSGNYENIMRKFLLTNKIPFDFINENPMFDTGSKKIFVHKYYDDRAKLVRDGFIIE